MPASQREDAGKEDEDGTKRAEVNRIRYVNIVLRTTVPNAMVNAQDEFQPIMSRMCLRARPLLALPACLRQPWAPVFRASSLPPALAANPPCLPAPPNTTSLPTSLFPVTARSQPPAFHTIAACNSHHDHRGLSRQKEKGVRMASTGLFLSDPPPPLSFLSSYLISSTHSPQSSPSILIHALSVSVCLTKKSTKVQCVLFA